jgi:Tfp pilus assembly protein PilX
MDKRVRISMASSPRKQQGIVLIIALTVLVAMSLAGVALMRSVDNTVVVAGNLAFKQASVQVADIGSQKAVEWLQANSAGGGTALYNTNLPRGYYSSRPQIDIDWFKDDTWEFAFMPNGGIPDASGNVVSYVIHRMCEGADSAPGDTGECAVYFPRSGATEGGSKASGSPQYEGVFQVLYRVTSRVQGPRNNITVVQSTVLLGANP